jgi:hypothetical protein
MRTQRSTCIWAMLVAVALLWVCVPAKAQTDDPFSIRVESNLVLVRAQVFRKNWIRETTAPTYAQCRISDGAAFHSLAFSEPFTPKDCYFDIVVHTLGIGDFHIFEDNVEQRIENVKYEPEALISARDNLGFHGEWSHTPQGKWSTIDVNTGWIPVEARYFYRLAYIPTKVEEGKCHKIKVTVDRRDAVVYATDQYCYTTNPATDPLNGTKFSAQMEMELNSDKRPRIPLSAETNFLYTNAQKARVDLVLEFPWDHLQHQFTLLGLQASIGVLGVAYRKDHTVAARFSDFGCCSSGARWFANPIAQAGNLPSRYETQFDLPAGEEYKLAVVLSDGENFGRVEIPLKIDSYAGKALAISSVALCNRFRDSRVATEEAAAVNLAPAYVPLVSRGLQFTPAAHTSFKSTDHLTAYFEVYEPLLTDEPKTQVQANVKIVDAQTGQTRFQFAPIDATVFKQPGSTTLAVAGDLPLSQLAKGDYIVEAQATDSAGHATPVRTAAFTIE